MKRLADEYINYFWNLLFNADSFFCDEDFVSDEIERLSFQLTEEFSSDEQKAIISAAKEWLESWTAEPDEHGYTRRDLLTQDQKEFLEHLANGKFLSS